jgi:hypothetical protein
MAAKKRKPKKERLGPYVVRKRSNTYSISGEEMAKKSSRIERDAGTGKYVPSGTEKRKPSSTVTEPRTKPTKKK